MYNRYIPQPDGSYRKNQMQESRREQERFQPPPPPPSQQTITPPPANCNACPNRQSQRPLLSNKPKPSSQSTGVMHFLKQLLPKNFDTEDLLVVLLLLLMSGDCQEDQNSALLTLALYLFL